jgi:hypothetical protein
MEAEFHVDGRRYMTKLIVAFRSFANASENQRHVAAVCSNYFEI